MPAAAQQPPLKIALIYGKTGPLEAYARQTEAGFMLGLEYATQGTMEIDGRKIQVILKDDQLKPDLAKAALEQAYGDDKVDIAVGTTSSAAALAMLPVAEEYKKLLIVEPAVADQITGDKWNRYVFRTARNSTQDALAAAATLKDENISIATLAQDYAFGKDGVASLKEALAAVGSKAKIVHEEYAPQATTDFTAPAQRIFDALKDKPGRKIVVVVWAGAHPLPKLMDLKPERYGIEIAPGGNILPVMAGWKQFPGLEGAIYYYWGFPKNPVNDWLVTEYKKKNNGTPPDFFVAGGMAAGIGHRRGGEEGQEHRHREADRRHGRHELRDAQGHDDLPQGGPSGAAGDVSLAHEEGPAGQRRSARAGARDPGRRAQAADQEQALIPATSLQHQPHPEEPRAARRLEGWARRTGRPPFETHRFAVLLRVRSCARSPHAKRHARNRRPDDPLRRPCRRRRGELRLSAGHAHLDRRAERRRQDDLLQPDLGPASRHLRQGAAERRGHHGLRRAAPHAARARPRLPAHQSLSQPHGARERAAGRAGEERQGVRSLLARPRRTAS